MPTHPTVFISYSWDDEVHKEWVRQLAARLRADGVDARLDHWHAVPGDQLPEFMEREIRDNDYVLIVCTPKYKAKSDERIGGVGYEGDIMTGEVFTKQNHRKFIPVLAKGAWEESAPSWLMSKYYVDLTNPDRYEEEYHKLLTALHGKHPKPPLLGTIPESYQPAEPAQQARLELQRVSLQLYDRRSPVYKAAQRLVDYIITKGACTEEELGKFGAIIQDARHLFNEDIENYLRTLYREATAVWLGKEKQERMAGQHDNEEYRRSLNALCDRLIWFSTQLAEIKRRFDPFLQIQK